jgi:hypothetical protein
MRNLDPRRFPGNPALVEQMRQQLIGNVDALELQLRRRTQSLRTTVNSQARDRNYA